MIQSSHNVVVMILSLNNSGCGGLSTCNFLDSCVLGGQTSVLLVVVGGQDVGGWGVVFVEGVGDVVGAVVEVDFVPGVAESEEVAWKGWHGIIPVDRSDVCGGNQTIEESSET